MSGGVPSRPPVPGPPVPAPLVPSPLVLGSPLAGWVTALDDVPDAVFAGRMLGDGVAVDPTGDTLHAPCDATVLTVHAARHAVTLAADGGGELLIHLGIDTVALAGEGLVALVAAGDRVKAGDPLLRFDLDLLVCRAPAVVTPVIATGAGVRVRVLAKGSVTAGDALLVVEWPAPDAASPVAAQGEVLRRQVAVALAHGLHARPAARVVAATRGRAAQARLALDGREASADSAVALLGLAIGRGATVEVAASGPDAAAVLDAIVAVLADATPEATSAAPRAAAAGPGLPGVPAAPGVGVGRAHRLVEQVSTVAETGAGAAAEAAALDRALAMVGRALAEGGPVIAAQGAMLDDPALVAAMRSRIAGGVSAAAAARDALAEAGATLSASTDRRIAERAADLRDIAGRLVRQLAGGDEAGPVVPAPDIPAGAVLLARDLLPSEIAALDPARVAGIALSEGGPTSHAAILAVGKGIAMAVAFGTALDAVADGTTLLLDADRGRLEVDPPADRIAAARVAEPGAAAAVADGPCRTADGARIELFANLGSAADAEAAVAGGAEGCGLLRTEFLFLDRRTAPDEAEQRRAYQGIADAMGDRPLIVRLLDVGGDKPAPYLAIPREENPALGLRGIRVGLARPDLLDTQLRAIAGVVPVGRCRIMAPMVASLAEYDSVADAMARAGIDAPLGVMIETPAAAITADLIARRAAFLSIGTNDLTQYALAMDRGNPAVAAGVDGLHPAVLRLIAATCDGAARHGRPVGVCGGLAADRLAVPILIGLGVTELSVPPARLGGVRAAVAATRGDDARALAVRALACTSPAEVRALAAEYCA